MTSLRVAEAINRMVTPAELRQALTGPISTDQREEVTALVRWFTTRYQSSEARLSYVRQASRRWRPRA
jgi:hypothetical protein